MRKLLTTTALVGAVLWSTPSPATLQLQTGLVGGSGDVSNVIFNACGLGGTTGFTVQGCLNTSHSTLVDFSSSEKLLIGEGGGQATITGATDGSFTDFSIKLDNPALGFGKLQFAIDTFLDGTGTFQAVDQFGAVFNYGPFPLAGEGLNKFTLSSPDNEVAVKFSLVSSVAIDNISDLEQVRIGPTDTTVRIPENGSTATLLTSLALFAGFAGLTGLRRRAI
jgi:hypothetical protein